MTITPDFGALCTEVKREFPAFTLAKKSDSWWLSLFGKVIGQQFMSNYVTTIGNTVYVPSLWNGWGPATKCALLRHERVHMRQARKLSFPVFAFLYMMVFLPLGLAYFRAMFEEEAYAESLAAYKDYGMDYTSSDCKAWMVSQFTTSAYGWMWPFPSAVGSWFDQTVSKLDS
jgi:hypothetical protein